MSCELHFGKPWPKQKVCECMCANPNKSPDKIVRKWKLIPEKKQRRLQFLWHLQTPEF